MTSALETAPLSSSLPQAGRPWYKEPWPWFLISVPLLTVAAGFTTLWLALRSADGVVADDYYKRGLAVNQVIDRDLAAQKFGVSANVMRNGLELRLFLTAKDLPAEPERLTLRLTHPTRSGLDQQIELSRNAGGFYEGRLTAETQGRRLVFLEDQALTWRLTGDWRLGKTATLQLSPHQ